MKPPKLPGTEKFKFCDKKYEELRKNSSVNSDSVTKPLLSSNFIRGIPSRSTCPSRPLSMTNSSETASPFIRYDSIRRPVFPISTRMSSRVLTLTHLPLDSFDIRDSNPWNRSSNQIVKNSRRLSIATCNSRREASLMNGSRVSLLSDSSSGSNSTSSSAQPSPRPSFDRSLYPTKWVKSAHRLSTSSQSSCVSTSGSESSESFWISRKWL